MRIARAFVAVGLLSLAISGCAPNRAWRDRAPPETAAACLAVQPADCADQVWHRLAPEAGADARTPRQTLHLAFVEFDDQGALHDAALERATLERIRAMSERQPLLIVVFAHGWKHDARAADGNVKDFADILRRIAWYDEQVCARRSCEARRVVGVYLGWRGLSARLEPFKELSFWARKERAHRVGADGATEVLAELAKIKANGIEPAQNRLIVTGHSFGGALVYTALQQQLVRDTVFLNRGAIRRNAANLVVLVNPAFEAARYAALERRGREHEHPASQRPVLAVFTSRKDAATRVAFPFGRALSTVFESHVSPEQRSQNLTALGHYPPFLTHDLEVLPGPGVDSAYRDLREIGCAWQDFQSGKTQTWSLGGVALSRRPRMRQGSQQRNPFYNVAVDGRLIANHSEIWGQPFSEFLYRFVAVQSLPAGKPCNSDARLPDRGEDDAG
jgi:hypothetical protein